MNDPARTWDKLCENYLRHVDKALASVDHPRKTEVVLDLRSHLQQRFKEMSATGAVVIEDLRAAIDEMGPPEQYAELLSPENVPITGGQTGMRKASRRVAVLLYLVVMGLLGVVVVRSPVAPAVKYRVLSALNRDFCAPPFFSVSAFRQIQPGMTKDEVRDLIGYASQHGDWSDGQKVTTRWDYSEGPVIAGYPYISYCVGFEPKTGKVIETTDHHASVPDMSTVRSEHHLAPKRTGEVSLKRLTGQPKVLHPRDRKLYVFLRYPFSPGSDEPLETVAENIQRRASEREERLNPQRRQDIELLCLVCDESDNPLSTLQGDALEKARHLEELVPFLYTDWDPPLKNVRWTWQPAVYCQGLVYPMGDIVCGDEEECIKDQQWLVKRLLRNIEGSS